MIRVAMNLHLILMTCVAAAFAAPRAMNAEDTKRSPAQQALEEKRQKLQAAESSLEAAYLRMEQAYPELVARPAEFADQCAKALKSEAAELADHLKNGQKGKPPARPMQLTMVCEALGRALKQSHVDPGFHDLICEDAADPLLAVLSDPAQPGASDVIAAAITKTFGAGRAFDKVWNEELFRNVLEAKDYARVHAEYLAAGEQVERERNPEKFDAGGQRLPPGMVLVKGSSFDAGPYDSWPRKGFDKRGKKISLKPFYIDRFEVTNADYRNFYRTLSPDLEADHRPSTWVPLADGGYGPPKGKEDHPVTGVNFNDALAYAAWAGKRLPTEDEWEAAARGAKGLLYPWGDSYEAGRANDRNAHVGETSRVGGYETGNSPFGCSDLAGNVEEWTASAEDGTVVTEALKTNAILVVTRGGSFSSGPEGVTATFRWVSPGLSTRKNNIGFRCAQSVGK